MLSSAGEQVYQGLLQDIKYAHRIPPHLHLDPLISSLLINNLYDWSGGSHLLLLNVKGGCSWPLHPPRTLTGNLRGRQASILSDVGVLQ